MAEKEYIEREAAIKLFNFAVLDCLGMEPTIRAGDIIKALESIPAADVRPVVTCGECEYCIKKDEHELWCNGFCNPARLVRKDDFCSHGTRNE